MVEAVLFDLFETLITESHASPQGLSSAGPSLGFEPESFRAQWKARRPAVMVGRLSLRQALADIAEALGRQLEDRKLERVCQDRVRTKSTPFERIEPRVTSTIDRLRSQGKRLGIISNCFAEDVVAWPACPLAQRFDCAVFSFLVGLAKPDPAIYLEATRRLAVDPAAALFIGDGMNAELSGAEQAGLRAFRALWFLRRWPNFRSDEQTRVPSLARVEDVVSLVAQADVGLGS